ncbi:mRNA cap guanine-N7 methyltransferase [Danaus plexippus]|uniref:mRNA cap guanine-N7 methyltransferase n=1 Tax=Danaus plexippus TaxID=13037 RepID=UPI002AAFC7C8|nr:mRNA cap guanine-N7 methyltransferase [Danaus plexippus]
MNDSSTSCEQKTKKNEDNKLKRTLNEGDDSEISAKKACNHANIVANHYNHLEQKGLRERFNSPILYLRNFNNWVKSVLIQEYSDKVREKNYLRSLRVLDICCGKGGDLSKWQKARADHVVFADIAEVSVQQCKERYDEIHRRFGRLFTAEFIAADCSRETLRDKYKDPSIKYDVVSCQFGLHYSFESLKQARRMLLNISECLKPGGYFFGTIPDAYEIVSRCKKSPDNSFENRICNIKLMFDSEKDGFPLFGAKYDFHLEGVVDCPEFLVYFDMFTKLALECGLELVYKAGFSDFYKEHLEKYKDLLPKIKCFENYPMPQGKELIGDELEYEHAKKYIENISDGTKKDYLTMSRSEWEVATVYLAFAFKKCKNTWNADGKPVYQTSSSNCSMATD